MDDPSRDEEAGLPGGRTPARQRSSVPSFLFISFMLFMLTSHNGDEFLARHQYQDALQSLTLQLSNYTAWMNGTSSNFSVADQDPAIGVLLDNFDIRGDVLDPHKASYYSNVTGFIHGSTEFYNITPSALFDNTTMPWTAAARTYVAGANETEMAKQIGTWNWTASEKLALSIVEKLPTHANGSTISDTIALAHGRIELTDVNTKEDLRLEFEGVHFINNGSFYALAEPTGHHIDIRLLPSLVPSSHKNETALLIEPELKTRINKLANLIDAGIIDQDSSSDEPPRSSCPFTFYAQLSPVAVPEYLMQDLEQEIQKPTGIWTIKPPKLSIVGLLVSKECGLMFEIRDTEGLRSRTFFRKVTTYAGFSALVYLLLLVLFSRQTERSRTPSGLGQVSRWLFLSQATIDSVSFAGHITFAILAEGRPSMSLVAPAFLACILFVYEAQFSVLVHQVQAPENNVPTIPTPAAVPSPVPNTATAASAVSPSTPTGMTYPPTTATTASPTQATTAPQRPTPAPPAPQTPTVPPESLSFLAFFFHHIRTDPQARLWMTLFIFLTFIVRVILSPTLSMIFVGVTYSLIWLPQILRSARRNRSSGLTKEYIIGTTLCRLYFALYFLACPKNVLDVEPRSWSYLLAAVVCFQGIVLMLQDVLSPSFFLPKQYVKVKAYDYHPPMPLPDPEAPEQSLGDCAICMDAIIVDVHASTTLEEKHSGLGAGAESATRRKGFASAGLLNAVQMSIEGVGTRKVYSLAPCHHLFHTDCLEKWLAIKNICPQCRRPLPPL